MALARPLPITSRRFHSLLWKLRKISGRMRHAARDESGHTLAETLVALTLFSAVLIPLLTAIGSLTTDDRAERIQEALRCARAEMISADARAMGEGDTQRTERGLQILRRITRHGVLVEVEVVVTDVKKGNRKLAHLARTFVQAGPR